MEIVRKARLEFEIQSDLKGKKIENAPANGENMVVKRNIGRQ